MAEKQHKHNQHMAKMLAFGTGSYALHEKHQAKKHPEDAHTHKVREHIAGAVAVGATVLAIHEKHEKKAAKKLAKQQKQYY